MLRTTTINPAFNKVSAVAGRSSQLVEMFLIREEEETEPGHDRSPDLVERLRTLPTVPSRSRANGDSG
jgi:hypothetical protein